MPVSEVYNMDCLEYMKWLPDKYFELSVVDPPYGIGAATTNFISGTRKRPSAFHKNKKNDWDAVIPSEYYFKELNRVSNNQIIWGGNYMTNFLMPSKCWIFWDKGNNGASYADGELAWTSFNDVVRRYKQSWIGANAREVNQTDRIHPTQKPIALYKWLLQNYAKEGDKILDTHMGSQSSRIAAYDMGFDYYGCELDKDYFDAGNKRFEQHKMQGGLFTPDEQYNIQDNIFTPTKDTKNKYL